MYPYFESIRVENGIVRNLAYHQNRVSTISNVIIEDYIREYIIPVSGIYKLRISYDEKKIGVINLLPYQPKAINSLQVVFCDTIDYSVKRENREQINCLYNLRGDADDILIIKNNLITDTSYGNILLYDGESWITPSSYLLKGTCRARLLHDGVITEREVTINDLNNYTKFMVINAMLGFNDERAKPVTNILLTSY